MWQNEFELMILALGMPRELNTWLVREKKNRGVYKKNVRLTSIQHRLQKQNVEAATVYKTHICFFVTLDYILNISKIN